MSDPRIQKLAQTLVRYSVAAGKGQTVGVSAETAAEPLVVAVFEELVKAGAFPVVRLTPEALPEILLRKGRPWHFTTVSQFLLSYARIVDSTISIRALSNTRALSATDPARQAMLSKTQQPISEIILEKLWVLTLYPTQAYAQDAEMSLSDFQDFVFGATFSDETSPIRAWKELSRRQAKLVSKLRGARTVRIVGRGTDLTMSVKGRRFINSDGHHNMPSGEIFTGPVEDTAEGHIEYDFPVCHAGREIDGVRLVFRKGRVVEASARKNEKFLHAMLDTDPGARYLGELGIGTNRRIQRFIKNILFDEKIGGTVHLALGRSYKETGGKNKSALHWDMIKDLRRGGALYVDGRVFQKDGKFV